MINYEFFLAECVFYPCSSVHGLPIKLLGNRFNKFFYTDYAVSRSMLKAKIDEGLLGYHCVSDKEVAPEALFGSSWYEILQNNQSSFDQEWDEPFISLIRFDRNFDMNETYGPDFIEILFVKCEAVAAFEMAFSQRKIKPKVLTYICSGISFGGNYNSYPQKLENAVRKNLGGLPHYLFMDGMAINEHYADYLKLTQEYREIKRWGYKPSGNVILAKLLLKG